MVRPLSTQFPRGSVQFLKEAFIVLLTNGQVLVKAAWVEFHKTVCNVYMYCFLIVQLRAAKNLIHFLFPGSVPVMERQI